MEKIGKFGISKAFFTPECSEEELRTTLGEESQPCFVTFLDKVILLSLKHLFFHNKNKSIKEFEQICRSYAEFHSQMKVLSQERLFDSFPEHRIILQQMKQPDQLQAKINALTEKPVQRLQRDQSGVHLQ